MSSPVLGVDLYDVFVYVVLCTGLADLLIALWLIKEGKTSSSFPLLIVVYQTVFMTCHVFKIILRANHNIRLYIVVENTDDFAFWIVAATSFVVFHLEIKTTKKFQHPSFYENEL
ncbi:hypothetical protein PFISCL1PPCAC_24577, partial [Pristionchus fissidentatus]